MGKPTLVLFEVVIFGAIWVPEFVAWIALLVDRFAQCVLYRRLRDGLLDK
jgi:hypothetical protein